MNDLVNMKVVHATGNLFGPVQDEGWGDFLPIPQDLIQLAIRTVLHNDTVTGSLCANTPKIKQYNKYMHH